MNHYEHRSPSPLPFTGPETFRLQLPPYTIWNINRGYETARTSGRPPVLVPVHPFAYHYGYLPSEEPEHAPEEPPEGTTTETLTGEQHTYHRLHIPFFLVHVDTTFAMSEACDLTRPILILLRGQAAGERPKPFLIDGHHRMYKAAQHHVSHLPTYLLTAEEELQCRLG